MGEPLDGGKKAGSDMVFWPGAFGIRRERSVEWKSKVMGMRGSDGGPRQGRVAGEKGTGSLQKFLTRRLIQKPYSPDYLEEGNNMQ